MADLRILINPKISNNQLNTLFSNAWENHEPTDFQKELNHSFFYFGAFSNDELIGFVKVIWDGSKHGFLLDPTVHKSFRHRGIGTLLVKKAIQKSKDNGLDWLHVDYEPHLHDFYVKCGFHHTEAGLIDLINREKE